MKFDYLISSDKQWFIGNVLMVVQGLSALRDFNANVRDDSDVKEAVSGLDVETIANQLCHDAQPLLDAVNKIVLT